MTPNQAKSLLNLISDVRIGDLNKDAMIGVLELKRTATREDGKLSSLVVTYTNAVSDIKAIRCALQLGLKEAKDIFDQKNPHRVEGDYVIATGQQAEMKAALARYIAEAKTAYGTNFSPMWLKNA